MSTAKHVRILASAWLGAVLLWAPSGFASQGYPEEVARALAMPCVPSCLLCHNNLRGGIMKLSPFGQRAKDAGLLFSTPSTIAPTMMTLETMMPPPDTDGDMIPDITELRAGSDPNEIGEGQVCGGTPLYGCGARIARERKVEPIALGAALGVALALGLARRRRRSIPR
jgi:hypothetical protein